MNASPRRYRVNSLRNSVSVADLGALDWSRLFTDGGRGGLFLRVYDKAGATAHIVRCRHSPCPRLAFEGGEHWWLVDDPVGQATGEPSALLDTACAA